MARPDLEDWADDVFLTLGLLRKKTFGCPSWYKGKKMVAFIYEDALGIKLPPERVLEKIKDDADVYGHFNPGDGVMRNWLMITRPDASEYEADMDLIGESLSQF